MGCRGRIPFSNLLITRVFTGESGWWHTGAAFGDRLLSYVKPIS
jgi:hypothetical protein